jgi:hypothetical protein
MIAAFFLGGRCQPESVKNAFALDASQKNSEESKNRKSPGIIRELHASPYLCLYRIFSRFYPVRLARPMQNIRGRLRNLNSVANTGATKEALEKKHVSASESWTTTESIPSSCSHLSMRAAVFTVSPNS